MEREQLERIVPQDLSTWPPYAQVLYLLVVDVQGKVDDVSLTIKGDRQNPGLKDQVTDHEKRLRFLEGVIKWAAGIGTVIITTVGGALAVHNAVGKGP
jgi:hypothetical protein